MRVKFFGTISSVFLLASISNGAELLDLKSSISQQNMVELFSSEGCSSCPPAEKWLGTLRHDPGLWKKFVPIEFHVDYWDGLGWKDPYASPVFTQRQRDYSELWRSESVYTPGVVLNGNEWLAWRTVGASGLMKVGDSVGVLEVKEQSKRNFVVKFAPVSKFSKSEYFINGALLGNDLGGQVLRGENSGENLHHDFVALSLKKASLVGKKGIFEGVLDLSNEKLGVKPDSLSVAFWISDKNEKPIQTVGEII